MTARQKRIRTLIIAIEVVLLLAPGFVLLTRERADADANWVEAGNAELLDSEGFWQPYGELQFGPQGYYLPYSKLQVGRNAYENLIHGTVYTVPPSCSPGDIFDAMVEFHAQRLALFSFVFSDGAFCFDHDTAVMVVVTAIRYGIDYRLSIPVLYMESRFGMGSHNFYGFACGNSGSFAKQTDDFFRTIAGYGVGSDPWSVAYIYNSPGYPWYQTNFCQIFNGCDGGANQ